MNFKCSWGWDFDSQPVAPFAGAQWCWTFWSSWPTDVYLAAWGQVRIRRGVRIGPWNRPNEIQWGWFCLIITWQHWFWRVNLMRIMMWRPGSVEFKPPVILLATCKVKLDDFKVRFRMPGRAGFGSWVCLRMSWAGVSVPQKQPAGKLPMRTVSSKYIWYPHSIHRFIKFITIFPYFPCEIAHFWISHDIPHDQTHVEYSVFLLRSHSKLHRKRICTGEMNSDGLSTWFSRRKIHLHHGCFL